MTKTIKTGLISALSFLIVVSFIFASSVNPAFAKGNKKEMTPAEKAQIEKELGLEDYDTEGDPYETGIGVHADPAVFEKNFCLSCDEKEYTIKEIERVVSEIIDPEMSDLEKYYTLAIWVNQHVDYDWDFWSGRYHFEYYSHQWDSYGGMNEDEKSVCAGIAVFYADMCHAADLPCKFLRMNPKVLDHTINYIPDINGHAYLVDVTENVFLMSENSGSAFSDLDKAFSHITKDADDESFDYCTEDETTTTSSTIKDYCNTPFEDWYKEYALHQDTDKKFKTQYEEKGSGVTGQHYASYHDYDSNRTDTPNYWFIDDFYADPDDISSKILSKQFDEQITNVAGLKKGYDCDTVESIQSTIEDDIQVEFFPSEENGKIVPKTATLKQGTDYELTFDNYDETTNTANFTIEGIGEYSGTQSFSVLINSAIIEKAPTRKMELVYNGKEQKLVTTGSVTFGEMQYALGTETEPTEAFSRNVPKATDAGVYYVWYKAVGDEAHADTLPERVPNAIVISKLKPVIALDDIDIYVNETIELSPFIDPNVDVTFRYRSFDEDESVIKVDENGTLTGLKAGVSGIVVQADLGTDNPNYEDPEWCFVTVNVLANEDELSLGDGVMIVLSGTEFTYNGKVQKPSITVKSGEALTEGKDYEVKWSDAESKNAGTYTVTINGKGEYSGTAEATYKINKAQNSLELKTKKAKVKRRTLKKKSVVVKRAKVIKIKQKDGTLSYSLKSVSKKGSNKKFKKYFKVNEKTGNITIKKGLKKGKYKVAVNVKASGDANHNGGVRKATVTIKVK